MGTLLRAVLPASAVAAGMVALATGGGGDTVAPAVPEPHSAALLGLLPRGPAGVTCDSPLVRLDPRTLRPRGRRRLHLGGCASQGVRSPTGAALAIASERYGHQRRPRVRFVDLERWRPAGSVVVGTASALVTAVAWPRPGRVLALVEVNPGDGPRRRTIVAIDPRGARVVARRDLPAGEPSAVARTPAGMAVLLGPRSSVGPARLVVVSAGAPMQTLALSRITAGRRFDGYTLVSVRRPGLAVDPEGNRAFVVGADEPPAEIDLAGGRVVYRTRRVSLLGRLREWLEPSAEAKGMAGPVRDVRWLGGGRLAVAGEGADGPAGLRIVDTADWSTRVVDRRAPGFTAADGALLVFEAAPDEDTGIYRGRGLTAYAPDGTERFHLFGRRRVVDLAAAGRYAYATVLPAQRRTYVVDLSAGRVVRVLARPKLPRLLDVGR